MQELLIGTILFGALLSMAAVQALRRHWRNSLTALMGVAIVALGLMVFAQSHGAAIDRAILLMQDKQIEELHAELETLRAATCGQARAVGSGCSPRSSLPVGSFAALPCAETQLVAAVADLNPGAVQEVVLCRADPPAGDVFAGVTADQEPLLTPMASITSRFDVARLVDELRSALVCPVSVGEMPFSGTLSFQVFVTQRDTLVITHVILGEAGIVAVSMGSRAPPGFRQSSGLLLLKSPAFAARVRAMMEHSENE